MRHMFAALMLVSFSIQAEFEITSADFDRQAITLALIQEPPQLNSMRATDTVSIFVLGHIMEGLVRYDRRGNIAPGVAERWEIDAKGATFWLRDNALWSDGEPVTAHDFVFAWQNVLAPETASEYAFILYSLKNGEAINVGDLEPGDLAVKAINDKTLRVEFERPSGYFLKLAAFTTYLPVRKDYFESKLDRYAAEATDMLYNGPFKLTQWVHSASLKMVKNERYWNKENIYLNEINAAYITADSRARLNLFTDGKIVHTRLDGETYKDALTQRFRIRSFATGTIFYLGYNHRPERVTSNLNLRKAIQHVFDPEEFVNKVLQTPGNLPGRSIFPVWLDGVDKKLRQEYPAPVIEVDIEKAKIFLQAARQEIGVDNIPPMVLLVSDTPTATKQAEYLQGLLKDRLGLDINIDIQTFKQRLAKMTAGEYDMVGAGWGPDYDDAMTFGDLFASWNLNNRGRYNNPEYDKFVRIAMNSSEPKVRMDAMAHLQSILIDDAAILNQYEQAVIYLLHPKLRGVVRRVVGHDPDYTYARVVK
ncbi:MAG: peptide ABC transporter substrate-binding protein [bacterium]|nr:peptide ABC transporter substrate-binding protein [Gammaproteobacteria bacterium]